MKKKMSTLQNPPESNDNQETEPDDVIQGTASHSSIPESSDDSTNDNSINFNKAMEQVKFSFDEETLIKIGKGFLIAMGGAVLTYLEEQIPHIDFGQFTGLVVALNSIMINTVREWMKGE